MIVIYAYGFQSVDLKTLCIKLNLISLFDALAQKARQKLWAILNYHFLQHEYILLFNYVFYYSTFVHIIRSRLKFFLFPVPV